MNLHWLLHNRRARFPQVRTAEWIDLACALSIGLMVTGFFVSVWLHNYLIWLVALIPAALAGLAAHFHDWSREI